MPVAGSNTRVDVPGRMSALEPGTLKPATEAVVPVGATTLSSTLPVAGTLGVVVSVVGGHANEVAAGHGQHEGPTTLYGTAPTSRQPTCMHAALVHTLRHRHNFVGSPHPA